MPSYERDADRVGRKPRKIPNEGKPEEKKLYVQLPIPSTRGKVGFLWPARPPFLLSAAAVLYAERTNLFPSPGEKKMLPLRALLGVRSVE